MCAEFASEAKWFLSIKTHTTDVFPGSPEILSGVHKYLSTSTETTHLKDEQNQFLTGFLYHILQVALVIRKTHKTRKKKEDDYRGKHKTAAEGRMFGQILWQMHLSDQIILLYFPSR